MDGSYFTRQLASNAGRFKVMVQGVSEDQARWKPNAETWSTLEIVNHLYDNGCEEFRDRLGNIWHHPEKAWAPIDPEGRVTERQYGGREVTASRQSFLFERNGALKRLEAPRVRRTGKPCIRQNTAI